MLPARALALLLLAAPAMAADYEPSLNARIFEKAWDTVDRHYWDKARLDRTWDAAREHYMDGIIASPDRRTFYTRLGEMLDQLGDSHVYAIDPVQIGIGKEREHGRASAGFGFDMLPDADGVWRVQAVRSGGAAARAGVEIGWEVRGVNGASVDIDYQPAPGEQARFDFVDEYGGMHHATIVAAIEEAQPVRRATRLPGGVLLIGLDGFDPGADRWIARTIADGAPPRAVILDLRGNDGGDADVVARVAGLFFTENRVLVRQAARKETEQMTKGASAESWRGPLAVLIGPNSASGAEALAALIDESGRGVTVGERTAGALTGASLYRLPDGGELSVAEFDIRTPSGRRLEGIGLAPKVPVAPTLADRRAGRDPVLARAEALLAR